jgi:hypothetical protein
VAPTLIATKWFVIFLLLFIKTNYHKIISMKQAFLILGISLSIMSCNSNGKGKETSTADTAIAPIVQDGTKPIPPAAIDTANGFPSDFKPAKTFAADKADLHESLKVQQLTDKRMAYEIAMVNGECASFTFKGVATLKEGDAESDVDEKGNGYFVAEYVDDKNGQCGVTLRIGADRGYTNRARFYVYDCPGSCKNQQASQPLKSTDE